MSVFGIGGNPNIARAMAQMDAKRDGEVVHVCPECGGDFAEHLGALIVVQICWACKGVGTLTGEQLSWYESESRARDSAFQIT